MTANGRHRGSTPPIGMLGPVEAYRLSPHTLYVQCGICGDDASIRKKDNQPLTGAEIGEALRDWGHQCRR